MKRLLQTQDVCLTTLAYPVALNACNGVGLLTLSETVSLIKLTPMVALLAVVVSRGSTPLLRSQTFFSQLRFALRHAAVMAAGVALMIYLMNVEVKTDVVVMSFVLVLALGLLSDRVFLKWWYLTRRRESRDNYLKVLLVGAGPRARGLMARYRNASEWGVEIVGILDPDPAHHGQEVDGVAVLGGLEDIGDILSRRVIDEVVVCLPRRLLGDVNVIVRACEEQGVCLKFMADIYDIEAGTVALEHIGSTPVLRFEPVPRDESKLVIKRVVDLLLVALALPVLLPVFLLVAAAVKLDSRGPVFFVQDRVGLHKRRFKLLKFRSMYPDAEQRFREVEHLNEADGPIFKMRNDPRVTPVGRFIRRTSLDELPQLVNVVLGHMSIIGPRPMSVRDVGLFSRAVAQRRFSVRPGLACLREVYGRSKLSFDRWLELDLKYIDEWSLALDFRILLRAIPSVLRGDGAS